MGDKVLHAFYDLNVLPISFDLAGFMMAAEFARCKLGLESCHLVLIPGRKQDISSEALLHETPDIRERIAWRLDYLALGLVQCFPSFSGYELSISRESAFHHAINVTYSFPDIKLLFREKWRQYFGFYSDIFQHAPSDIAGLQYPTAPLYCRQLVQEWLSRHSEQRQCVTITMRGMDVAQSRNSDADEWAKMYEWLEREGYFPVFVPETDACFRKERETDYRYFSPAALDIGMRLALYEEALLSLFVASGPNLFALLSPTVRQLSFRMIDPSNPQSSRANFRNMGFDIASTPSQWGGPKKMVEEADRFDVIRREFLAMRRRCEQSS